MLDLDLAAAVPVAVAVPVVAVVMHVPHVDDERRAPVAVHDTATQAAEQERSRGNKYAPQEGP